MREDVKVPVQLAVGSKDPDSLLCENIFDGVWKRVSGKTDLQLLYVAEIDDSEPDFGVVCPQGPSECSGNVHQLCAAKYAPSFPQWWEFIHCSNYHGRNTIGTRQSAFRCANSARIDWNAGFGECSDGEEGVQLLKDNVKEGKELGIERSCSIIINESTVCVRDSTWKECEGGHTANDFVRQINDEFKKIN
ncbi:hypothetical protein CYLTODRAFT_345879 [Cylindrobasidium torrendii FP15055 ss-10]|uniref:Uncharacterized protein n=1 Tax=Cylindrobasidium torrendii FP15055 ss-10 TaxID=1314674 RepID=A0A0D7BPE7_9AGAR|nr:hypothetical protein CYLTODRAFT_345879 [Cylindrobasidium torrendii FP15055 ss-10]